MTRETLRPPRFSEQEDEALVCVIAPTSCLYDPEDDNFKNQEAKAAHWLAISKIVKRDIELCKRRWKDIKNNYYKIKKQRKTEKCNWSLYDKLKFLDPIYENNATSGRRMVFPSNDEDRELSSGAHALKGRSSTSSEAFLQDQDSRSGMDMQPSTSAESTIRKRRYEEVSSDEDASRDTYNPPRGMDDVDLFMRSIAVQMKKMSPRKIAQAKVRILTIVNELQFGQLRMGDP